MTKYLLSRFLIVLLVKFYSGWIFNLNNQIITFFDVEASSWLNSFYWLLFGAITIISALISINGIFTFIQLSETIGFKKTAEQINLKNFKLFITNYFGILNKNFEYEIKREKYPNMFLLFVFIFIPFFNGNPILNNYYGIYKEYEFERQGRIGERTDYIESQNFIIHKSKINELNNRMANLENNYDEDEPYFDVKKRGYLFLQSGLIDGFKSNHKEYTGIFSYLFSLLYYLIEKLVITIMYFFIPFLISIMIYEKRTKHNNGSNSDTP